jgi:excisionase family DNA binding protein
MKVTKVIENYPRKTVIERRLLTVRDMAECLGTTMGAIYQMVSRRQIPFVKIGRSTRFDKEAIDAWIKAHSKPTIDGK